MVVTSLKVAYIHSKFDPYECNDSLKEWLEKHTCWNEIWK